MADTSVGFSDRSTGGRKPKIYNLDMILSVGYRVNSKRGIAFRKWANNVLKEYILKGYAINEKRLQALKKTVDIQSRMIADALDIEEKDVLRTVNEYTDALILLDQYDHQALSKSEGSTPVYRIHSMRRDTSSQNGNQKSNTYSLPNISGSINDT